MLHLRTVFLLLLVISAADAQPDWRFWLASDGMVESYARTVGLLPGGPVAVRHGLTETADLLDGYDLTTIPEPRAGTEVDYNRLAPIYALSTDAAWVVENKALKQFRDGEWVVRAAAAPGDEMLAALPLDANRVLVLFTDRAAEFSASSGRWTTILGGEPLGRFGKLARGFEGQVWLAAARGIIRLDSKSPYQWTSHTAPGLVNFDHLAPGRRGELFAVASREESGESVLLHLADGRYTTVFTSKKDLRGWRGANGRVWVLDGATLSRRIGNVWQRIDKRGPLSGIVYDVATEPGGGFWIASSTGVAQNVPPLWRTPDAVRHIDQPVHSIAEDKQGHVWFAADEYLVRLSGSEWKIYPLPGGMRTQTYMTASLAPLADGTVAFTIIGPEATSEVVTLDPLSGKVSKPRHSLLRGARIWRRDAASAWVTTANPCGVALWDGLTVTRRPDINVDPLCEKIRYLHEGSDGRIWVGTTAYAGGSAKPGDAALRPFGKDQGYPETGVYALYEHQPGSMLAGARKTLSEFDGTRWRVLRTGLDAVRNITRARTGDIWVASGSGLHRFRDGAWLTHGEAEGLPSDIAHAVFQDRNGRIWAGTSRGLSRLYPNADRDPPHVVLATSNPSEMPSDGKVVVAFSGVDRWKRTSPERLLFSHRFDAGPWTEFRAGATEAVATLKRGAHTIEVRAMDRAGNIGPVSTFNFAVAYPWYQQTGFLVLTCFGLAAISTLLWFAHFQYRQLARAKQAAETASSYKSQFLANMSHEIRTPMNAIMGMTGMALDIATSAEQREYLKMVRSSSESLLSLLNDILDLSKVEAGKLRLTAADFDLYLCIQEAVNIFKVPANSKGLALWSTIGPDVPRYVSGDELRLRQVLLNLLGNAIKFTSEGSVSVAAALESPEADGIRLRFSVRDTGIGVPPEKQMVIFAPFEQVDVSDARNHGGAGLGLAVSIQLVRLMHGDITVESPWSGETGEVVPGSAFTFTACFGPGREPERRVARATASAPTSLRVLVAEDNAVNQLVLVRALQKLGHAVMVAADGEEAVRVFERESPDVVLMDVQMPLMDGFKATAEIRKREKGRRTPIVAVTAHALEGYREICLKAGMDDYVTKPVRMAELLRVLSGVSGQPDHDHGGNCGQDCEQQHSRTV